MHNVATVEIFKPFQNLLRERLDHLSFQFPVVTHTASNRPSLHVFEKDIAMLWSVFET
jgi:hypothetical protein